MRKRQPLPTLWMMSDERMGDAFLPALARLPKGAGLIFRHYATPPAERRALFEAARTLCRRRRIRLVLAGTPREAMAWRADGAHGREQSASTRPMIRTAPAHNATEAHRARQAGADLIFLSPVFPTRSHPGARTLGRRGLAALAHVSKRPVIALGGMTPARFKSLKSPHIVGWAAIDGVLHAPKRTDG